MNYQQHLETVTLAVNLLGFEHISPESLMALQDAIDRDEIGPDMCRAYRIVMAGFRALFAPVEAA
jgi:hypothetical protein